MQVFLKSFKLISKPITIYFKISTEGMLWRQSTLTLKNNKLVPLAGFVWVPLLLVLFFFYVHAISLIEDITYVAHTPEFLCYHE